MGMSLMRFSRYPRYNHPIAPRTLSEILVVTVPKYLLGEESAQGIRLCDLDSTVWQRFNPVVCKQLAHAVVHHVRSALHSFPRSILDRRVPSLPDEVGLDALEVEWRTHNCLSNRGLLKDPATLGSQTIGNLLGIPGFGAKSLVDLLTSLEGLICHLLSWSRAIECSLSGTMPQPHLKSEFDHRLTAKAKELQRVSYAEKIHRDDPRLGHLILEIDIGAKGVEDLANRLVFRRQNPPYPDKMLEKLGQLHSQIQSLSRMKLEDELLDLAISTAKSERKAKIAALYFGWDGRGGCTLEAAGNKVRISRERVRQICHALKTALSGKNPFAPATDRALEFVLQHVPGVAEYIEENLSRQGLANGPFRLEGLANAANLLGRKIPFAIAEGRGTRLAVAQAGELPNYLLQVLEVARKSIEHWGVATVAEVSAQVAEAMSHGVDEQIVCRLLLSQHDFQWLDEARGWFWLRSVPRNALLSQIHKILSIAERIAVSELRVGVARHHSRRGLAPPRRVLLELCRQLPEYRVVENTVIADRPLRYEKVLSSTESTIVRVLREHGPVMQRAGLEKLCLSRGMHHVTFSSNLSYSPIIVRYAREVYGLRGTPVPPGMVERVMAEVQAAKPRRRKVLLDYGWTSDRKIWIGYRLSEGMISNGSFYIAPALKRFLNGEFHLKPADGSHIGTLVLKGSGAWGLRSFFRRRGGDPGDCILLLFDLATRDVIVSIGDATLLDRYHSPNP